MSPSPSFSSQDASSGRTALHYAVEQENFILVNFLLENGCNVNAITFAGERYLLSRSLCPSWVGGHTFSPSLPPGNTPLHIAAGRRLKEIVALLMAYGANPAIANGEGDFPTDLPASLLVRPLDRSRRTINSF